MEFGLGLLGYSQAWEDVSFAEAHGFTLAGFVDSPLLGGDPFVCLGLAAQATTRIRLGPFIAVPGNRTAATTATAIATVARLAPGRTFLGLGSGYTSRNTFGLGPLPASALTAFAAECRTLLAGADVVASDGSGRAYRLLHAEGYVDPSEIPVLVAGDGPRALAAAGTVGDGWITTLQRSHLMATSADVFTDSLRAIQSAAGQAGRPAPTSCVLSTGICLLEPGEPADSPRALELVGPLAMLAFHSWADNPAIEHLLPPAIRDRLPVYQREVIDRFPSTAGQRHQWTHGGHLSHLLPGEEAVLTDEIVRMTTLTGTPEEVADTLGKLQAAGLSTVTLWIPPHLTRPTIVQIEEKLMPLVGEQTPVGSRA